MNLSPRFRRQKLEELARAEGYATIMALLEASALDSVSPGICTEPNCGYTTEVEPDQHQGHCESCGRGTVASALILAGLI